jgi:hypothetical protein
LTNEKKSLWDKSFLLDNIKASYDRSVLKKQKTNVSFAIVESISFVRRIARIPVKRNENVKRKKPLWHQWS